MLSIVIGIVTLVLGLAGIWVWHTDFFVVLRGLIPLSLVFAGVVAIIAGFSSLGPRKRE